MCGRFIQVSNPEKIRLMISDLDLSGLAADFIPSFNITPGKKILAVLNTEPPLLSRVTWGLVPFWAKDAKIGQKMINARAETLVEKSSFKGPFRKKRCVIVADGFYEWRSSGKTKTPFLIRMNDAGPFAFAGLWDLWKNPAKGETLTTAAIITTQANDLVAAIHHRMPAILDPGAISTWLTPGTVSDEALLQCIISYPLEKMEAYEVSGLVNNPSHDSPDCIARV